MSRTQVYTWFSRFKNSCEDLNDDPTARRSETSNCAELVEKFVKSLVSMQILLRECWLRN